MLGVTNGVGALEGQLGNNLDYSSDVHCTVNYFGPADLRYRSKGVIKNTLARIVSLFNEQLGNYMGSDDMVVGDLLGGLAKENPELAAEASPILHVDENDPPVFIIHGTADPLVKYWHSVEFTEVLEANGVDVLFQTVTDAGHGNFGDAAAEVDERLKLFLDYALYNSGKKPAVNTLQFDSGASISE